MRAFETEKTEVAEIDRSVYDIKDKVNAAFEVNSGLTAEIVEQISKEKHDPDWMREFRLKALDIYNKASIPNWGPSLEGLDMRNIVTYVRPNTEMRGKWSEVPDDIKNTFERLGIPQAERSSLAGVGAQYDSEVVYHNVKEEVAAQGVVYTDMESALPRHHVGVMLGHGDDDFIALMQKIHAVAVGNEVQALRRVLGEHDLVVLCVKELRYGVTGSLVGVGGAHGQLVNAAVGVRVLFRIVIDHRVQDLHGVLGRGGAVQIDKAIAVFVGSQNRKISRPVHHSASVQHFHVLHPAKNPTGSYQWPGQSGRPPSGGGPVLRSGRGSADSRACSRRDGLRWRRAGPRPPPHRRG